MARFIRFLTRPSVVAGILSALFAATTLRAQESPSVEATITAEGSLKLFYGAAADNYYVLWRGDSFDAIAEPRDAALGDGIRVELGDALSGLGEALFFRIEPIPRLAPLDLDGDGIDDFFELQRRPLLDPLFADDAALDPDEDGRTNRMEYDDGSDPLATNAPKAPTSPSFLQPTGATAATTLLLDGADSANPPPENSLRDGPRAPKNRGRRQNI